MATVSILNFAERVVLPFSAAIPVIVGIIGYVIWKRDRHRDSNDTMTNRMRIWFMANSAALSSIAVFHVIRNIMLDVDYRFGMGGFAMAFIAWIVLSVHVDLLKIRDDDDLLLNTRNETAEYAMMTSNDVEEFADEINKSVSYAGPRKFIAVATYLVIVFQSGFDGLVLKYNPNAEPTGVQVAAFFVSKLLESIIVSTALIHAVVKTKWYVLYMLNFTITVGLSTLAAYDFVSPTIIVAAYEFWLFQLILGVSGGVLLGLSYYFIHLESQRMERVKKPLLPLSLTFVFVFAAGALTGFYG